MRTRAARCVPGDSGSTQSTSSQVVGREDASASSSSHVTWSESSLLQSEASPVLVRKTVASRFRPVKAKCNSNANLFSDPESPIFVQKFLGSGGTVAPNKLHASSELLNKRKILPFVHPSLLSDRKNIMIVDANKEDVKKSARCKCIIEMTNMDQENQDVTNIRKSGRTKKATEKFSENMKKVLLTQHQNLELPSQRNTLQRNKRCFESLENIASVPGGRRNAKCSKMDESSATDGDSAKKVLPKNNKVNDPSIPSRGKGKSTNYLENNVEKNKAVDSVINVADQNKGGEKQKDVTKPSAVQRFSRGKTTKVFNRKSMTNKKENESTPTASEEVSAVKVADQNKDCTKEKDISNTSIRRQSRRKSAQVKVEGLLTSDNEKGNGPTPPQGLTSSSEINSKRSLRARVAAERVIKSTSPSDKEKKDSSPAYMKLSPQTGVTSRKKAKSAALSRKVSGRTFTAVKKIIKASPLSASKILKEAVEIKLETSKASAKETSKISETREEKNIKSPLPSATRRTRRTDASAKESSKAAVPAKKMHKLSTSSTKKSLKCTGVINEAGKSGAAGNSLNLQNYETLRVNKPPIWASERSGLLSPKARTRRSIRGKSSVFDFSPSPENGDRQKKKKPQKRRVKPKAPKQRPGFKTTLLITNLDWDNPTDDTNCVRFMGSSSQTTGGESIVSATSEGSVIGGQSTRSATFEYSATVAHSVRSTASDYNLVDDIDMHDDMDTGECHEDRGIYARGNTDVLDNMCDETASSFVTSPNSASTEALVSASNMPTPAILKHFTKEFGSSTPRVEHSVMAAIAKEPENVKEDIAQCFGFEDSDNETENEDSRLSLSPVRQSGQQSLLNITSASEMFDSINQTSSQPYRFSWGSLRPGYRSCNSSRSASMVAQGGSSIRSTTSSLSSESPDVPQVKSKAKNGSSAKSASQIDPSNENTTTVLTKQAKHKGRQQESKPTNASQTFGKHDVSILFDEDLEEELEAPNNMAEKPSASVSFTPKDQFLSQNAADKSPNKAFERPACKSYDKKDLEEARKKFIRECGGIATTEAETEEDASVIKEPAKKKKTTNRKRVAKKKKQKQQGSQPDLSQSTDDSTIADPAEQGKQKVAKKKKKKVDELEKSLHNWASDLNTHFSEIEDCELVVM